ncbi:MAG: multiprotein bridging factor aMBF1 [Candidatus Nanohaloarchaea archaeon]
MPSCQLCGKDSDKLQKTKIEGATLKVCDSCSDMGEKVEQPKKKTKKAKKKKTYRPKDTQVLANDYGTRVKEAREDRKLSINELADSLNEKASLIKKIEREDLKPEKSLAKKLSKELEVTLYVNPEVSDHSVESGDDRKATLGDVADVKES